MNEPYPGPEQLDTAAEALLRDETIREDGLVRLLGPRPGTVPTPAALQLCHSRHQLRRVELLAQRGDYCADVYIPSAEKRAQ